MAKAQSRGTCLLCGGEKPKSAMSRHLATCDRRARGDEELLPVVVEGAWAPAYWLHLELTPGATPNLLGQKLPVNLDPRAHAGILAEAGATLPRPQPSPFGSQYPAFLGITHRTPPLGSGTSPLRRGITWTCTWATVCPAASPTFTPTL